MNEEDKTKILQKIKQEILDTKEKIKEWDTFWRPLF